MYYGLIDKKPKAKPGRKISCIPYFCCRSFFSHWGLNKDVEMPTKTASDDVITDQNTPGVNPIFVTAIASTNEGRGLDQEDTYQSTSAATTFGTPGSGSANPIFVKSQAVTS